MSEIALASGVLAGQFSLTGFGLVLLGILLSRHLGLSPTGDPGDAPLLAELWYRHAIYLNARAVVLLLLGTAMPVAWLLIEGFSIWFVVAAYVYSALIVLYILFLNVWAFVFRPGDDGQGSIVGFIRTIFWRRVVP